MKKSIILLLLLSFVLTGCQNTVGEVPTTVTQPKSNSAEFSSNETTVPAESDATVPFAQEPSPAQDTKPYDGGSQSPNQADTSTESTTHTTEQPSQPVHTEDAQKETAPADQESTVTPEILPTVEPSSGAAEPTEAQQESINAAEIECSAESYAASLGFVVDNSLGKGTAGYYPPDYRPYTSMQDSLDAAIGLVAATKNQLNSRFSTEHSDILVEGAYGLARVNCQVVYSHSDELGDWYYIYVFYG